MSDCRETATQRQRLADRRRHRPQRGLSCVTATASRLCLFFPSNLFNEAVSDEYFIEMLHYDFKGKREI